MESKQKVCTFISLYSRLSIYRRFSSHSHVYGKVIPKIDESKVTVMSDVYMSHSPLGETKNFCSIIVTHFIVGNLCKNVRHFNLKFLIGVLAQICLSMTVCNLAKNIKMSWDYPTMRYSAL